MIKNAAHYRRVYGIRQNIAEHFSCYKLFYILLGLGVVAGLVIGLVSMFRYSGEVGLEHLSDSPLSKYLSKDISIISLFFTRFFTVLGLFTLIWVSNCKPWLCFIAPIIVAYRAFLLGANCAVLILLFNISGVVNVLIVYIPCHLLMLVAMLMWSAVCMRQNIYSKQTMQPCVSPRFLRGVSTMLIICGILVLLGCLLEALLLPLLTVSFFMGIS